MKVVAFVEAARPSGEGAGFVIRRSRVQILLPATRWIPDSSPPRFLNSQLVSLLPVGIIFLQYLFGYFSVHNMINTAVHNTSTLK